MNRFTQYMAFCIWFLSLTSMFSRLIHVATCVRIHPVLCFNILRTSPPPYHNHLVFCKAIECDISWETISLEVVFSACLVVFHGVNPWEDWTGPRSFPSSSFFPHFCPLCPFCNFLLDNPSCILKISPRKTSLLLSSMLNRFRLRTRRICHVSVQKNIE